MLCWDTLIYKGRATCQQGGGGTNLKVDLLFQTPWEIILEASDHLDHLSLSIRPLSDYWCWNLAYKDSSWRTLYPCPILWKATFVNPISSVLYRLFRDWYYQVGAISQKAKEAEKLIVVDIWLFLWCRPERRVCLELVQRTLLVPPEVKLRRTLIHVDE